MIRPLAVSFVALFFGTSSVVAKVSGTIAHVDKTSNKVTLNVAGQPKTYAVDKNAVIQMSRQNQKPITVPNGLAGLVNGSHATVTTETRDGKEVATKIMVHHHQAHGHHAGLRVLGIPSTHLYLANAPANGQAPARMPPPAKPARPAKPAKPKVK